MKVLLVIILLFGGTVAAGVEQCNSCFERNATICSANQKNITCATDKGSFGTTHCVSAIGKYRDDKGNVQEGFLRGCIDCADKKAACFALGGFLKSAEKWTLLQCGIKCCNSSNCNTNAPTLSKDAITVFTQNASGPTQCNKCNEEDAEKCSEKQKNQICAIDDASLGTTHCGSAVGKYRDNGKDEVRVIRGCIDCADKKAACAAVGGYLREDRGWTLLECKIECCTENNCNKGATPPPTTKPTTDASRNLSHHALLSGVLAFATVFGNIL